MSDWRTPLADAILARPRLVIAVFLLLTVWLGWSATHLRLDPGFNKLIPLGHPYMQVYAGHAREFGGGNRLLIAVQARDGDMFTPEFFAALDALTDAVFFLPGVDRPQVQSLFTPNVRYTEVVEDGIRGGNVIPDDFVPDAAGLAGVRENILKADLVGRLVAEDFSGALISARLLEIDPATGERLDYLRVAADLERTIRAPYATEESPVDIHIIGFAQLAGDIAAGSRQVLPFFVITVLVCFLLLAIYAHSLRLAALPVACALLAVVWQLGLLPLFGLGLDPMSILVPFLVFAIAVSHGVQMLARVQSEWRQGASGRAAARNACRALLLPGLVALVSDSAGFLTILAIDIGIIREMAISASLGVAVIILTNLVLLPVLIASRAPAAGDAARTAAHRDRWRWLWKRLSALTLFRPAMVVLAVFIALLVLGYAMGSQVRIGDRQAGVPELREEARYNRDSRLIAGKYAIGLNVLTIYAGTRPQGCVDYSIMRALDDFAWRMLNVPGVSGVRALPPVAKHINTGFYEGDLKWHALPRDAEVMAQALAHIPTTTGLLNADCSVMPVYVHAVDHRAETIDTLVDHAKRHRAEAQPDTVDYRLAGGNLGIMAATNQVIARAQFPVLLYVYGAVIVLCLFMFHSLVAVVCIVLPLALTSLLTYALMNALDLGLKVNTLPVVVLGIGIGVDYGIYVYSRLREYLLQGHSLRQAYELTLSTTGAAVLTTALTLIAGVMTWVWSPLKLQADMGLLLMFMFLVSMLGAVLVLPALRRILSRRNGRTARDRAGD